MFGQTSHRVDAVLFVFLRIFDAWPLLFSNDGTVTVATECEKVKKKQNNKIEFEMVLEQTDLCLINGTDVSERKTVHAYEGNPRANSHKNDESGMIEMCFMQQQIFCRN